MHYKTNKMALQKLFRVLIYFFVPYAIGFFSKPNWTLCLLILIPYLVIVIWIDVKVNL